MVACSMYGLPAGALEEVDWLRMKLERIEGALKDQVGKGGTLARIMSRQMDRGLLPTSIPKDDTPAEQASGYDHLLVSNSG